MKSFCEQISWIISHKSHTMVYNTAVYGAVGTGGGGAEEGSLLVATQDQDRKLAARGLEFNSGTLQHGFRDKPTFCAVLSGHLSPSSHFNGWMQSNKECCTHCECVDRRSQVSSINLWNPMAREKHVFECWEKAPRFQYEVENLIMEKERWHTWGSIAFTCFERELFCLSWQGVFIRS